MIKKIFSLFLLCAIAEFAFAADVVSEMTAAYKSGFYPGVVRYADELLSSDPSSVFAGKALVYEGESLYRMGRRNEAASALERAKQFSSDDDNLQSARAYWTGRVQYDNAEYEKANASFYECAQRAIKAEGDASKNSSAVKNTFYDDAILYAARTNVKINNDKAAVPLFEYVIAHGKSYSQNDYEDSVLELLSAYNRTGNYKKTEQLGVQFKNLLSSSTDNAILLYRGDAQSALGNYKAAYDLYTTVMTNGTPSLAVTALQRAYAVSSAHKTEVGAEPGSVIARAENQFASYPDLVAEFRTRLAIDAYNSGDYTKATMYFDQAAPHSSRENLQLAALYRAEIALRTSVSGSQRSFSQNAPKNADDILSQSEKATSLVPSDSLYTTYVASHARYAGLAGNWASCKLLADSALSPVPPASPLEGDALENTRYWASLARYEIADFEGSIKVLDPLSPQKVASSSSLSEQDIAVCILYARSLAKAGRSSEADQIFYSLGDAGKLPNDGRIDYTKTLLLAGHLISAGVQSSLASGGEADYLSALASFNRRRWGDAESGFRKSLTSNELSSSYKSFALFYMAYAQYREGKNDLAYDNMTRFITENNSHQLVFTARMIAARAAVQNANYNAAYPLADEAVRTAPSESAKQEAVLFSAGVYTDGSKYDKALAVLAPYLTLHTDFGIQCRYQTAQIDVQKKDYDAADKVYASLAAEKSDNQLVEESSYRRGELAYTTEKYESCIPLFDSYRKSYPQGRFYDAALYFTADSLARAGSDDKAMLLYLQLIQSAQASTYKYGAEKNLVSLYEKTGDYDSALKQAQSMITEYGEQARTDGMADKVKQLKSLAKGGDVKIIKKEAEYDAAGGIKTEKGRAIGTELAELYASSPSSQKKAVALAEQLAVVQKKNKETESAYAARTAILLGTQYRMQNLNKKSAEWYLSAAEYFRMNNDDENAARSLYGAVESFDAAGMYGDSKETAKTLSSLYPQSKHAAAAQTLVNK